MHFHIDTNRILLTDEIIHFLIENDIYLQVSLDGPREIHDRYRVYKNGRGTFNRITGNLKRIREISQEYFGLYVSFALTIAPPYELEKINDYFQSEPYSRKLVNPKPLGQNDTSFFEKYNIEARSLPLLALEKIKSHYIYSRIENKIPSTFTSSFFEQDMITIYQRHFQPLGDCVRANGICLPGARRVFVSADGKYYPCERVLGSDFMIGDVDNGVGPDRVKRLIENYIQLSTPDCFNCRAEKAVQALFFDGKKGW